MAPAYQVIKEVKIESSVALHAVSHSVLQRLHKITKGECRNAEILNTCTRWSNEHLLEISCKNEVLIKSYSA